MAGNCSDQRSINDNLKLDHIAGQLSTEINMIGTLLGLEETVMNSVKLRYLSPREVNFQILWQWFRNSKGSSESRFSELYEILIGEGRTDITESKFVLPDVRTIGINIHNLNAEFTDRDARHVSSQLGQTYMQLGRYLGLAEHKMEQIFINQHRDIQEQAYQTLIQARQANILRTRADICKGLCYIQRKDIIEMLNDKWENNKK